MTGLLCGVVGGQAFLALYYYLPTDSLECKHLAFTALRCCISDTDRSGDSEAERCNLGTFRPRRESLPRSRASNRQAPCRARLPLGGGHSFHWPERQHLSPEYQPASPPACRAGRGSA